MKKVFKPFMVLAAFAGLMLVHSCAKTCDAGLEGSDCKTLWSEKFIGSYHFSDPCTPSGNTWTGTAQIASSSSSNLNVVLTNFDGTSSTITASLTDSLTISLPGGTYGGLQISSTTGHYSNGVITWGAFTANDGSSTDNCTSTWTKL